MAILTNIALYVLPPRSAAFDAALEKHEAWLRRAFAEPRQLCPDCGKASGDLHDTPCPNGRGHVPCRAYMAQPIPGAVCECGASFAEHERYDPASVACP